MKKRGPVKNKKISAALKKAWANPAYRNLKIEQGKAQVVTDEQRAKNSAAKKAQWADPAFREKMAQTHLGKKASEATRAKMRRAHIGHPPYNKREMLRNEEGQFVKAL